MSHESDRHPLARVWAVLFVLWAAWRIGSDAVAIVPVLRHQVVLFKPLIFVAWICYELVVLAAIVLTVIALWRGLLWVDVVVKGLLAIGILEALSEFARTGASTGFIALFVILVLCLAPLRIVQPAKIVDE